MRSHKQFRMLMADVTTVPFHAGRDNIANFTSADSKGYWSFGLMNF